VEHLDFPAQGIPLQLLDRLLVRANRQVRDELPVDSFSVVWLALLIGVDHGRLQRRVMLLLPNWREESNPFVFDLKNGNVGFRGGIPKLEPMRSADFDPLHFIGNRMVSVSGQAIDAGPDQEMSADLLRCAEKFIDIALAVANVNAARRIAQGCGGLLEVFQPADAFLLLDRNPRQVDSLLERRCSLEMLAGPEFDRGQAEWKTFARHGQTRVHQDATNRMRADTTGFVSSAVDVVGHADEIGLFTLKREFGRVMQNKDEALAIDKPTAGCLEMAR
jgi:hypothetical protein